MYVFILKKYLKMSKSIEIITEINGILRDKGFNRKEIEFFYNEMLIVARNKKRKENQTAQKQAESENLLKHLEPKYLVQYIAKRLSGRGYLLQKSPISGSNTYYFKSSNLGQRPIRISNHNLHESQIKESQIDIVIQPNFAVTINKEKIEPHPINHYKSVVAEKILALLK